MPPAKKEAADTVESTSLYQKRTDYVLRVALLADSHGNVDLLNKALVAVKSLEINTVFYLGDLTDLGVENALEEGKKVLDESKLTYYILPGDHDLWKSVGPENFKKVFGETHRQVTINGVNFVLLDNSANYTKIDVSQMAWFEKIGSAADFILLPQPIYHPYIDRVMGVVNGEEVTDLHDQAQYILKLIRNWDTKAVIAADQHTSSQYPDPVRKTLKHIVVGAITDVRNLQTPRFAVLTMYKDGAYDVEDITL